MSQPAGGEPGDERLGAATVPCVLALYGLALAAATYPVARNLTTELPSLSDPMMHLWVMRWAKSCLLQGRAPFVCPEVQYPVGASLGNFSPMHLQSLLYVPLSFFIFNDVLIYNILWILGFLGTGLGTFALAWRLLRDSACATFAGLAAMLSTPMMIHAIGHLELIYLGAVPLFLLAWLRLLERPGWRRLAAAAGLYLLVVLSAAYFAVLVAVPAVYVAARQAIDAIRRRDGRWLVATSRWLAGFVALTLPILLVVFANQLWAASHGHPMARPWREFRIYGAPAWSYLTPTSFHALRDILPFDLYAASGVAPTMIERASYLGLVTLALVHYAAWNRVTLPRRGYWWSLAAVLVVLSLGAGMRVGETEIGLPAGWLWRHVFVVRLIRMPGRFNLLVVLVAALLASAGLKHLRSRLARRWVRDGVTIALGVLLVADLSMVPFGARHVPPPEPNFYRELAASNPSTSFLEIPIENSAGAHPVSTLGGYWQSRHGARTTGGYSGLHNDRFDDKVVYTSPFSSARLADPNYLKVSDQLRFDVVADTTFDDYAWLYLTALDLRYVVLHRTPGVVLESPEAIDRVRRRLSHARVIDDPAAEVFDRERLTRPRRPVLLCTDGWHRFIGGTGPIATVMGKVGEVVVYNPSASTVLIQIETRAFPRDRVVRLVHGVEELARWNVECEAREVYDSPPLRLPAGLSRLRIECDGEDRPKHRRDAYNSAMSPYSLRVRRVSIRSADPSVAAAVPAASPTIEVRRIE